RRAVGAVGQVGGDPEAVLGPDRHQRHTLGPARDHAAQRELGRLAALIGAVEHGAVQQLALVIHADAVAGGRTRAAALAQHHVLQAGRGGDHALLVAVLGHEGLAVGTVLPGHRLLLAT